MIIPFPITYQSVLYPVWGFLLSVLLISSLKAEPVEVAGRDLHFQDLEYAATDTIPYETHPDSIAYSAKPTFGTQVLNVPATVLHVAILPIRWGIIYNEEHDVLKNISEFLLNEEGTAGFYPSFSVGGRTDFAAGITYFNRDFFNAGHSLEVNTFYTNRANYKFGLNYKVPPRSRRYQLEFNGGIRKNNDQDIYFGGNSGRNEEEVDYGIEQYNLQASAGYLARSNFLVNLSGGIKHTAIHDVPSVTEQGQDLDDFIDAEGFGLGKVTLVNGGLNATLDRRNGISDAGSETVISTVTSSYDFKQTKIRVYSGALYDAGISYNTSTVDNDYEFLSYYADWQQFLPVPGLPIDRRLAFRARLEKRYPLNNGAVPFYEQSLLGDADNLRGYEQDRFRNLGSLLLTLEYRYPIWDTWDAVIFTDQGQVFREYGQLSFSRFNGAYGTGLRFMTASDFLFRVEIAFSKEGSQGLLKFNMNF